ncbi:restriction endonuclease subunit S [Vannielia litorea]|uniref:restriction endonuclease subunit S n=1 Tax=Vannielia litorea TaxID=1217970 RepID=UPI001C976DED|nr:restriction endonuclease subunit S [Vannielia litorea]MBY6153935.1 restriction endonuclease subunit S [Vannielia litorea]
MKDAVKSEWQVRPLGEVVTLNYGKALARSKRDPDGGIPVYGANGVMDWSEHTLTEGPSLVIGRKGSAGEVTRVDGPFWPSDVTYYTTHDHNALEFDFLHYTLQTLNLPSMARGVKPGINRNDVYALPIPLPPLEEQQRIVAVLDEAFEGLARARAHAETNLKNARELFESAIEAALERAGGEPVTLQEMMDTGMITGHLDGNHGSDYPRKAEFVSEGVPYISANCIADNVIDFGRCKYLTPERASGLRKGVAKNRDVLFAHNATVGPVTLLKTEEDKVILSTSLTYYRCNEEELIPEFLVCEMRSAGFRRQYEAVMAQATRNQVPITMQRKFIHLIPPLEEQRRISELGVELEAKCSSAIKTYEASLKDLDDLRQSLLQIAFAGELS